MNDFFEIDFLDVETAKSGDAIPLRYRLNGQQFIHVVDGGFQDTGDKVVSHIRKYYDSFRHIDHVIATHPDGDHTGGLRAVLEQFQVKQLWMLRPWLYASEILGRFTNYSSVENLQRRLKAIYSNLAALEDIAIGKGIPIYEPFQGARIGAFTVLAPGRARYLDLIVSSERTPESPEEKQQSATTILTGLVQRGVAKTVNLLRAAWGAEVFSLEETSSENEMSVIQYANICGKTLLLTADAGRAALAEAANYAQFLGLAIPGIDRFQVPHHGSRRNLSTEVLDRWLGARLSSQLTPGQERFTAIISSAKKDEDHPRKAVVRAMIHRGAKVHTTEGNNLRTSHNAPQRDGWNAAVAETYPDQQES